MRIRASGSGFYQNGWIAHHSGGCPRVVKLKSRGLKTKQIPEIYAKMGAIQEDLAHEQLKKMWKNIKVEEPVKKELPDKLTLSGRCDFFVQDALIDGLPQKAIIECKATMSPSTKKKAVKGGMVNTDQLAQMMFYFLTFDVTIGYFYYRYFDMNPDDTLQPRDERVIKVQVKEDKFIYVDDVKLDLKITDYIKYLTEMKKVDNDDNQLPERPDTTDPKGCGPCHYCPYSEICDESEIFVTTFDEFLKQCQAAADMEEIRTPKPYKRKRFLKGDPRGAKVK